MASQRTAPEGGSRTQHNEAMASQRTAPEGGSRTQHNEAMASQRTAPEGGSRKQHTEAMASQRIAPEGGSRTQHTEAMASRRTALEGGSRTQHTEAMAFQRTALEGGSRTQHTEGMPSRRSALEMLGSSQHTEAVFTSNVARPDSSQDIRRDRDRHPPILGSPKPRHRSESRRLSDRRRRVKTAAGKRDQDPGALCKGDAIQVFSRSAASWIEGEVVKFFEDDFVRVEYEVHECLHSKILHLESEHLDIRPATAGSSDEDHYPGLCTPLGLPNADSRCHRTAAAPGSPRPAPFLRKHVAGLRLLAMACAAETFEIASEEEEQDPGAAWLIQRGNSERRCMGHTERPPAIAQFCNTAYTAYREKAIQDWKSMLTRLPQPHAMETKRPDLLNKIQWKSQNELFARLELAEEVHVLSSPYVKTNPNAAAKCCQLKKELMAKNRKAFVFDPNTDMTIFAGHLNAMTPEQERNVWLKIWASFAVIARDMRKEYGPAAGQFHFMCKRGIGHTQNNDWWTMIAKCDRFESAAPSFPSWQEKHHIIYDWRDPDGPAVSERSRVVWQGDGCILDDTLPVTAGTDWDPRSNESWDMAELEGYAQEGELRIAVMGGFVSHETGLYFYECYQREIDATQFCLPPGWLQAGWDHEMLQQQQQPADLYKQLWKAV